jgi:hypothetical protein
VFQPDSRQKALAPPQRPLWWAAGRNWPRAFHQLVEITRGSLRALFQSTSRGRRQRFGNRASSAGGGVWCVSKVWLQLASQPTI